MYSSSESRNSVETRLPFSLASFLMAEALMYLVDAMLVGYEINMKVMFLMESTFIVRFSTV